MLMTTQTTEAARKDERLEEVEQLVRTKLPAAILLVAIVFTETIFQDDDGDQRDPRCRGRGPADPEGQRVPRGGRQADASGAAGRRHRAWMPRQ